MSKTLAHVIGERARHSPHRPAFLGANTRITWSEYDRDSSRLAAALIQLGLAPRERVAVWLPDGPGVHIAYVGAEKAGLTVVGIGPRAGLRELEHLLALTGASALLSRAEHRGLVLCDVVASLRNRGVPLRHHVVVQEDDDRIVVDGTPVSPTSDGRDCAEEIEKRRLGAEDLFPLNSTSGTNGTPKCVKHDQRRWFEFHRHAVEAGALCEADVFMSVVPSPFGFGIWTSHVTPTLLGAPTVLTPQFDAHDTLASIERHGVTILAAVSTQFIMLLNSPALERHDLGSLRALFTGGEAVPRDRAAEFEDRTGAKVLQFYGSNEAGALSHTALADTRQVRLETAGRVIPEMNVRLFDVSGREVGAPGRGQPGCRGPLMSSGYYGDEAANRRLFREDGWMLLGDIVSLDDDGVLRVVGRADDFIIRGGKNISARAVEEAVARHPAVGLAAAVAMPDPIFGERVCVYVETRADETVTLSDLVAYLTANDVSKEILPERLVVLDELPRATGGKVAKSRLRADIRRRLREDSARTARKRSSA